MPIESNDPHGQQPQAQAKPQPEPQPEKRQQPLPQINTRQPTRWPDQAPRPDVLLVTVRKLAKERRVGFLDHSEERLAERGFDVFDVYDALEKGHVDGPIFAGRREGEWKTKLVSVPDGTARKMGVVTIVVKEQRLLIKTVEWEDR